MFDSLRFAVDVIRVHLALRCGTVMDIIGEWCTFSIGL